MVAAERLLKTRQVAEALGVSPSTVKRWVDSGVLSAARTVGRHRLVPLAEAVRVARSQDLPTQRLQALIGLGSRAIRRVDDTVREELISALRLGQAALARHILVDAHAALGDAAALADDLIRPVMEQVGHEWQTGSIDVFQEHLASRIVESTLAELIAGSSRVAEPAASLALGASPEGDRYTLAGLACELALRELGWAVMNYGASLPLTSLAKAAERHKPRVIWLSISHLDDRDRFVREYAAFHATATAAGAAICLGGSALDAPLRARLIAASFGDRVAHLVEFARRIAPYSQDATLHDRISSPASRD